MAEHDDENLGPNEISAKPTKALFVDMLTRDITLDNAVSDLVDNCVDGARRIRPDKGASLLGLRIVVTLGADAFEISDNCGGIPIALARQRAFRFGRRLDDDPTPNSVGQFGVGMKRALFKFGRYFEVCSTTTSEQFTLIVDVDEWQNEDTPWTFQFTSQKSGLRIPVEETGTRIAVTRLRDDARLAFAASWFQNSLSSTVESAQQEYIERGLTITCAGRPLMSTPWTLLEGAEIIPGLFEKTIGDGANAVLIRIYVGVSDSNPKQAGWYVACNGRTILSANRGDQTGWATTSEEETIPGYHNQFARFRGYAFFDAANPSLLPWNTTKDDIEIDSPTYKFALAEMIQMMRPVIDFLNDLDRESGETEDGAPAGVLKSAIDRARPKPVRTWVRESRFSRPPRVAGPSVSTITAFSKPSEQVANLKVALSARSNKDVGIRSFDFAYRKLVGEPD